MSISSIVVWIVFVGITLIATAGNASSLNIKYEQVLLQDFNPDLVDIKYFEYKKFNDSTFRFSVEYVPQDDFNNDVNVDFKMYKRENGKYVDYPLAFQANACDVWEKLYNVKEMEQYGNMTACNIKKGKMMYVKDYIPNFTLPNFIDGTFRSIAKFYFNEVLLSTVETHFTLSSALGGDESADGYEEE